MIKEHYDTAMTNITTAIEKSPTFTESAASMMYGLHTPIGTGRGRA